MKYRNCIFYEGSELVTDEILNEIKNNPKYQYVNCVFENSVFYVMLNCDTETADELVCHLNDIHDANWYLEFDYGSEPEDDAVINITCDRNLIPDFLRELADAIENNIVNETYEVENGIARINY